MPVPSLGTCGSAPGTDAAGQHWDPTQRLVSHLHVPPTPWGQRGGVGLGGHAADRLGDSPGSSLSVGLGFWIRTWGCRETGHRGRSRVGAETGAQAGGGLGLTQTARRPGSRDHSQV